MTDDPDNVCLLKSTEALGLSPIPYRSNMNHHYAQFVTERFKAMPTDTLTRLHAAVGISGEAGELLDAVKKAWAYNKPLDVENVHEELGDCLFYIQAMCNQFGWTFESVIAANVAKLIKRYPTGYSDQAAQDRADKTVFHHPV